MNIDIKVEQIDSATIVRVTGEIDLATAPQLRESLDAIKVVDGVMVVDLSNVSFMDSTGLGVLVGTWKRLTSSNSSETLRLVVTQPVLLRVIEVSGLSEIFMLSESLEGALQK